MAGGEEPWWGEEARRAGRRRRPWGAAGRPTPGRRGGALGAVSLRAAKTGGDTQKATL